MTQSLPSGAAEEPAPSHEATTHGVGPHPHPQPWPEDPRLDPELLAAGDTRNVVDRYRYWSMEAIVADLDTRRHAFDVAIENWQHDLNIGSIVRSANAFLAGTVHIIGRRRWNKRGAMVTDRYQHVRYHSDVAAFAEAMHAEGRPVIAIDNTPGAERIETAAIPERCVFLFGQEGPGLTDQAVAHADAHLEITQFGSTRSINASAAAAIVMHSWIVRHADLP
uniref:RNA methyltransferase n=1 Tax=Neobacillus citreus TaxID=2833578 RepID=A0A942SZ87_9BACI